MIERKNVVILIGFVLSVSFIASSMTALWCSQYYKQTYFQVLGDICQEIIESKPEFKQELLSILKKVSSKSIEPQGERVLVSYGYNQTDFESFAGNNNILFYVFVGFIFGGILFLATILVWFRKETLRIQNLTGYLEMVNTGSKGLLIQEGEDKFSQLQDEIYKTVTMLYQTKEEAIKARNNFAENLSNIAHQIKTPITSISLSTQMLKENHSVQYLNQISQQIKRLTYLEEALLLLSQIDAGTLYLERKETDLFTILMLASDNLQPVLANANLSIHIIESDEIMLFVDLDWTMEAVMNLFKNCAEHSPLGGIIYCQYEQNPLYTQVQIWDMGDGFAKEDIPHLFERFYRGKRKTGGGIGIGLSLSKAMIEMQNGTIRAYNCLDGGACFEIRFYCH